MSKSCTEKLSGINQLDSLVKSEKEQNSKLNYFVLHFNLKSKHKLIEKNHDQNILENHIHINPHVNEICNSMQRHQIRVAFFVWNLSNAQNINLSNAQTFNQWDLIIGAQNVDVIFDEY